MVKIKNLKVGDKVKFKLKEVGGMFDGLEDEGKVNQTTGRSVQVKLKSGVVMLMDIEEVKEVL